MSLNILINKGLELAGGFLSYLREKDERDAQFKSESLEQQRFVNDRLLSTIDEVAQQISSVASDAAFRVTQKIESDRLEDLAAQIKGLNLAIQVGNDSMLGSALSAIGLQIEYAKNRLKEGKSDWLGAWMMAESMRLTGLSKIASPALVEKEAQAFRIGILNNTQGLLIRGDQTPWVQIAQFVGGKSEALLGLIQPTGNGASLGEKVVTTDVIRAPAMPGSTDIKVTEVFVKHGQDIKVGDELFTVATDKVMFGVMADKCGRVVDVLVDVLVEVGSVVVAEDILVTLA